MAQVKPWHVNGKDIYIWKYLPSIPAASIFIALFTIVTTAQCWRIVKTRSWFCIWVAVGGLFQIFGYTFRIYSYYHTDQLAPSIVQNCGILLAPIFYAVSIYMTLGRIIRGIHGERFSIIRPSWMTKIFVWSDIITLSVQGDGAGLAVNDKHARLGQIIVIVGLFLQLIMFGFFVAASIMFHIRMRKYVAKEPKPRSKVPWRQGLDMLYACSALLIVRGIFRIIEYILGEDGFLLSHEWPTYVFDASLMWPVQVIFLIWFPEKFQVVERESGDWHGLVPVETTGT